MKYLTIYLLTFNIFALQLEGKLLPDKKCMSDKMGQLFISEDKKLIYQIEMPSSGTFSLKLPSGNFKVSYIMKDGCNASSEFSLKKEIETVSLKVKND